MCVCACTCTYPLPPVTFKFSYLTDAEYPLDLKLFIAVVKEQCGSPRAISTDTFLSKVA